MAHSNFANQLRRAIRDSGLALYAIAVGTGLDYATVHRFYHQKRDIRLSSVGKLADYLGLELTEKAKKPRKGG